VSLEPTQFGLGLRDCADGFRIQRNSPDLFLAGVRIFDREPGVKATVPLPKTADWLLASV
jgi:hypothetical protein